MVPSNICLVARVTTVDEDVGAGHEAGRVGGEEDAEAVELVNATQAVLGGEGLPDLLLGLEGRDTVEGSVHVTGGDAVDTDVVLGPLGGDGLGELDDTSLGGVVAALLLGVVDNGARHGSNEDDATGLAGGHHGAADGLGHEEGTSKVDVDETTEHGGVVGLGLDVGVGNTGSVDENVGAAVVLNNGIDGGVDGGTITHIDLEEGDGKTRLLVQLSGGSITKLLVGIEDDDRLGTGLGAGTSHVVAQTTSTASDDDVLAKDAHVLEGLGHGVVNLLGERLDGIALDGRGGAIVGDLGVLLGDVEARLGAGALALIPSSNGDLLLADDALLVLGLGNTVHASGGEGSGSGLGCDQTANRSRGAGETDSVAGGERHLVCFV